MNKSQNGSTLVMVFCAGIALAFLAAFGSSLSNISSKNRLIFEANTDALRVAESLTHTKMGVLTTNPLAYLEPDFGQPIVGDNVKASVQVFRRSFGDIDSGYYMVASATKSVGSDPFCVTVHTYFQMSNIGDYFAAAKEDLHVSKNSDLSQGKVYARFLTFDMTGTPNQITRVKQADYVTSCTPPTPWSFATKSKVMISEPASKEPVKLAYPRLFPQVLEADIEYYRAKAHVDLSNLSLGHHKCEFSGDIFPPGYVGLDPADGYAGHTNTNQDHVYFCTGTMSLQGTVYGQVLFVAVENIILKDSLISKDLTTTALNNGASLPGAGLDPLVHKGSSTAHQAILITPGSVFIDTSSIVAIHGITLPALSVTTIKIEGLILAPNGTIKPMGPDVDPLLSSILGLEFTGSMIVSYTPSFASVFGSSRNYKYMTTLASFPPPDLPYITDIYYQFEK